MTLKKFFSLNFFIFLITLSFGQSSMIDQAAEKEKFLRNKLYVVFLGNPNYDSALKKSFSQFWTVTPVAGFIKENQLRSYINDESNSFIIINEWAIKMHENRFYPYQALSAIVSGKDKWHENINTAALSIYKHKYEILPEDEIIELITAKDGRYALAVPLRNVVGFSLYVYDLGTMDVIAIYRQKGTAFTNRRWVAEKAFSYLNDCLPDKN